MICVKNLELLQILLDEYDEIRINLEKELTETGKAELYTNLTKLIVKIADHIFEKEEDIRKGIGDVMGGKVLELESERLKAEGEARLGDLINRLIQDQRMEEIQMASTDPEKREQLYKEYGQWRRSAWLELGRRRAADRKDRPGIAPGDA